MCGRYVSAAPVEDLAKYFSATTPEHVLEANFNVAPTEDVYAVRADNGERALASMRWGLVPFWAKDLKIGSRMINARSESVADKPAFRRAFTKRRCLLPADGFYEWQKLEGQKAKQPWFIHRTDDEPLVFAGLYEFWHPKDDDGNDLDDAELVVSCTILCPSCWPLGCGTTGSTLRPTSTWSRVSWCRPPSRSSPCIRSVPL